MSDLRHEVGKYTSDNCILIDLCLKHTDGFADICRTFKTFLCDYLNGGERCEILSELLIGYERTLVERMEKSPERELYCRVILYVVEHCVSCIGCNDDTEIFSEYMNLLRRLTERTHTEYSCRNRFV